MQGDAVAYKFSSLHAGWEPASASDREGMLLSHMAAVPRELVAAAPESTLDPRLQAEEPVILDPLLRTCFPDCRWFHCP
jgi:hypothetical protein